MRLPDPETRISSFVLPVEHSKVHEMNVALMLGGDSGDGPALVVPTFTASSGHWQDRRAIMVDVLGLDLSRVLHGEQRYAFNRFPRVGEVLEGTTAFEGVTVREGRKGGSMRLFTLRTDYRVGGEDILSEHMLLIEVAAAAPSSDASENAQQAEQTPAGRVAEPPTGDIIFETERVSRTDIVRYAGASGDLTRIHHDEPYAIALGLPSVFSMGMLQGGVAAAAYQRGIADPYAIKQVSIRFADRLWADEGIRVVGGRSDSEDLLTVTTLDGRSVATLRIRCG
jgi:acyl dehydratase